MAAKLSESLKRVLSSSDSGSESEDEDAKKLRSTTIEPPAPRMEPMPFAEIPLRDIDLEERVGIGNASTIFKGIWQVWT